MGIQHWSDNIIIVDLPDEPEIAEELEALAEMLSDRDHCNVVIDFSSVNILTSSNLSKMIKLRQHLLDCERRLIFCGLLPATRGVFTVTGMDKVFELADDKFDALATLEMIG